MNTTTKPAADNTLKRKGQIADAWGRLKKQPVAMVCLGVIILLFLVAIFADLIADYQSQCVAQNLANKLAPPSAEHWLGTDQLGRDTFGRTIHGVRTALLMGVLSSAISIVMATILACLAAYFGGWVDTVIMRVIDIFSAIPPIVIALAICAGLGNGMWQLIIALSFGGFAIHTRMIRASALAVAKKDYIETAVARGAKTGRIMIRYIIPNVASIIIIQFASNVAINILQGATLSFIGLGVQKPRPEWGGMLNEAIVYMRTDIRLMIVPAVALAITALAVNTFGDYVRDALDPQLKGKA